MAALKLTFLLSVASLKLADGVRTKDLPGGGPSFSAPAIAPEQFLLVSSPSEKKVVWTTLQNFESSDGRAFALVDSGLDAPKGLAFDHKRGYLYIADTGAQKIFRYTVLADLSGSRPTLTTSGVRLTITQGHPVEWLATDDEGNLFYTAPDTNNINKVTAKVMRRIAVGEFHPSELQIVSEKTLEAQSVAAIAMERKTRNKTRNALPTDPPPVHPHILSIYESKLNPHVSSPASISVEGENLYWVNQKDGTTAGTIIKGQAHPKPTFTAKGAAPFPAVALTNVSKGAFGLGKSKNVMFFSRNGTKPNTGRVTGLLMGTDITIDFVTSLAKPRGLVWDKDQTMYVADESGGHVWSFPVGRMMANVPLTRTVAMHGAYAVMLLSSDDEAFKNNKVHTGGKAAHDEDIATQAAVWQGLHNNKYASFLHSKSEEVRSISNSVVQQSFAHRESGPLAMVAVLASVVSMLAFLA